MDRSTHDVRQISWFSIITECLQRPTNVSAKQWLADNDVKGKAYYYVNGIIKIPTLGGGNSTLCYAGFKPFVILKA
jgi:hypothetical protein